MRIIDKIQTTWNELPSLRSTTPFDSKLFKSMCHFEDIILDIGCGYGRICEELENIGYKKIYGIDSSIIQLQRALKILKYTKLFRGNALNQPFKKNTFDCLITFGLINCLLNKLELEQLVQESNRILKRNGLWFINLYYRNDSPYFDIKYKQSVELYGVPYLFKSNMGMNFRHYSLLEFISVFYKKFDVIKCDKKKFLSFNQKRTVAGYSIILQKPKYISRFRKINEL